MSQQEKCLFCDRMAIYTSYGSLNQGYGVECPNCGKYRISDIIHDRDVDTVSNYLPKKHLISGYIREMNEIRKSIDTITTDNIMSLGEKELIPKTLEEKLQKILLYYYRQNNEFGHAFRIDEDSPYSVGYAKNIGEFYEMHKELENRGYIRILQKYGTFRMQFKLTAEGIARVEKLSS